MASKIQSHNFYVAITPYKVEDSSADVFNLLNVRTAYDDRRKYFYVDLHAGWDTGWGGFGCILTAADDPLTGPKYVKVKDAPKNSQKTINEMGAALELAKDAIAWLFDHRDWTRLHAAVRNIALYGYTEQFRKQMEDLISNNQNKEDEVMRLNINNKNNESKNVQNAAPVMNQVNVESLMGALSKDGKAKLSDHFIKEEEPAIEDAQAEEIESVSVGEVTVDSIQPTMQPVEEDKPVSVPLGNHGTLVIGGVPKPADKPKPQMPKRGKNGKFLKKQTTETEPDPEAVGELAGMLTRVRLVTYTTKRGETAPRIVGFSGEDDPRWKPIYDEKQALVAAYNKAKKKDPKAKMTSSPFGPAWLADREGGSDEKTYCMTFGVKYMECAKALCEAYNTTDRELWKQAEQAVRDCKAGIAANYQAERAAKRAEREAKKNLTPNPIPKGEGSKAPAMSAEEQAMYDLFKKFMAGDKAAMEKVGAVLAKAA